MGKTVLFLFRLWELNFRGVAVLDLEWGSILFKIGMSSLALCWVENSFILILNKKKTIARKRDFGWEIFIYFSFDSLFPLLLQT